MSEKEEILTNNFKEYYEFANEAFSQNKFNSATTLYFKALVALIDLFILKKEGFIPSSHTNRFRIIQERYQELYKIADRDFPFYQNSYTAKMDKETAQLLKEDVEKVKKTIEI